MFNFKTDFFSQPKVGQIIETNQESDMQATTIAELPESAELPLSAQSEAAEQANPARDAVDAVYQELTAWPELPDALTEPPESTVTETRVFYHPGCIDTAGANLLSCDNTPVPVTGLPGDVVAKLPVVLAELSIRVNVDAKVDLPEQALEIKEINKSVKLTQCLVLQDPEETIPPLLFLKGFIRKNINYAAKDCSHQAGTCGDIRHCTVDVPFSCTTPVVFNGTPPVVPLVNTVSEFQYFRREDLPNSRFSEKDELLSGDLSEFNQVTQEFYNELPYGELVSARIVEYDEFIKGDAKAAQLPPGEQEFFALEQKMVLLLTIKILQKQQVYIPPTPSAPAPSPNSDLDSGLPPVDESETSEPATGDQDKPATAT
ncbi:CsxC family protein [Desulforamulus hydrothermalis]|uniref:DUF7852 domain-containing protein n=1 Tax=Desulforamulus hydrothermalis Lam5 = DSM 18033 TaxID=1121428 RepID=K8DXP8_9FIRM|nr:hypothetical protein [Desulforamulus hydrothermalis]CCO07374.1 conserved hypothetical protein [Desulforamulus hydrothermalis Lam5 = DSM 18033]SHG95204.1 hypothetical protein SAMN02745177_00918 [Desulforamulus hydrothermalis Lam5 = DSM 18033]